MIQEGEYLCFLFIAKISIFVYSIYYEIMKVIGIFENGMQAEMMRQVLENGGVRAYVIDENMGSMLHVAVGGVKLAVDDADVEKAEEILNKD